MTPARVSGSMDTASFAVLGGCGDDGGVAGMISLGENARGNGRVAPLLEATGGS